MPYDVPETSYARRPLLPYVPPGYAAPYARPLYVPAPAPLPELPQVVAEPLDAGPQGGRTGTLPEAVPDAPLLPEPEPPRADAAPPADPVTDLLLTPLPQRDAAQSATPRTPTGPDPFMGFRPMRGQAPRPAP